jgi:hypothetical protein
MMRQRLSKNRTPKIESKYDPRVKLTSVDLFDRNYNKITEVVAGESLIIEGSFNVVKPIQEAIVGVQFWLDGIERSFACYSSQVADGKYYHLTQGEHKFRITIPKVSLKAGMYNIGVRVSEEKEMAEHAVNIDKYIIVKNPCPEFGLYNMKLQFDMDKKRTSII